MNPYRVLLKERSRYAVEYSARILNGSTFRMFEKNQSNEIRAFLTEQIGDGREIAKSRSNDEYMRKLARIVLAFKHRFRMNDGRPPNFGQAAKVVNLYVKHLIMLPEYLMPVGRRHQLEKYAHVPLDRQILERMWGTGKGQGDFQAEMRKQGICKRPKLSRLEDQKEYERIQGVLAKAAHEIGVPAVAYDYFWAVRSE